MKLYTLTKELVTVKINPSFAWAFAVLGVGVLNIVNVLPGWMTIAAILTLPFVMSSRGLNKRCGEDRRG